MNRAISKITVADGRGAYFRAGDVVRLAQTGEVLRVTACRGGGARYWHDEKIPLWTALARWARGEGWKRRTRVVDEYWRGIIRVYRERPSPLPRRLP